MEQSTRRAEFDEAFARDVLAVHRESPLRIRLELRPDPEAASRSAGLAVKETGCCSFFAFDLDIADAAALLGIETAAEHAEALAALGNRAETLMRGGS